MPEGSVSAITTSITKLNEDHIQAQARRIELEAQLGEFRSMRRRGRDPDTIPQVGQDEVVAQINGAHPVAHPRPGAAAREVQGGPPRGPEGPGPARAAREGQGGAGLADRGEPARRVPPAPAPGDRAQGGHRRAQGPGRRAEPQADRARVAQEAGRRRRRPLRGAPPEAERDQHRRLDPEQQRAPAGPGGGPRRARSGRASASWLLVSLLAGLLLGAGWVLLRDALDNTIKDARRRRAAPAPRAARRHPQATRRSDTALATEAYQNLRTALLFSRRGDRGHVVLVTGAAPARARRRPSCNLGRRPRRRRERTVLVDCDLRRPTCTRGSTCPGSPASPTTSSARWS